MTPVRENPKRYQQTLEELPPTFKTRDGHILYARLIQPSDADGLLAFFERMSSETRRRRFHMDADHLSKERKREVAREFANVDNLTNGGAVLVIDRAADGTERIVGSARLARPPGESDSPLAEAAVVVEDDFQGRGIGTELLFRTLLLAKRMGIRTIFAELQPDNQAAIRLSRKLDLPTRILARHGETVIYVSVPES